MYENGRGVPQNDEEAARWYRLAAGQGHTGAQGSLGFVYVLGDGVPQDNVTAHMWFNLAASGSTGTNREMALENRDRVAARMTRAGVGEAQRLAREWRHSN